LIATCKALAIPFVQDPSNEALRFARVRLRKSAEILGEEGLTPKRLSVTAKRLARARKALDDLAHAALAEITLAHDTKHTVLNYRLLVNLPEELVLRCLLKCIERMRPEEDYMPRMEKIEGLLADLLHERPFRKRTLGGLVFETLQKKDEDFSRFIITCEG
jgi:tRNA(Ile)-lysidine synthase